MVREENSISSAPPPMQLHTFWLQSVFFGLNIFELKLIVWLIQQYIYG